MIYKANCKINIGLSIIEKRNDGFHNLSTLIYPVKKMCDLVEVTNSETFSFTSSGLVIDCSLSDNLCVKAYDLLKADFEQLPPLHIHLHKINPFGAGLGGGSSDATATLMAINEFCGLNIAESQMIDYAARLGSDTPFFVRNRAQLCSGRGEIMSDIDLDLSSYHITVVKPAFSISTREAFGGIVPAKPTFDLSLLSSLSLEKWRDVVVNDFEKGLFVLYPQLQQIKELLYEKGAIYASLSGSGSALYAISERELPFLDDFISMGCEVF